MKIITDKLKNLQEKISEVKIKVAKSKKYIKTLTRDFDLEFKSKTEFIAEINVEISKMEKMAEETEKLLEDMKLENLKLSN